MPLSLKRSAHSTFRDEHDEPAQGIDMMSLTHRAGALGVAIGQCIPTLVHNREERTLQGRLIEDVSE